MTTDKKQARATFQPRDRLKLISGPQGHNSSTLARYATRGPLVIIGGAEEREGDCTILRAFLDLAGGSAARIVVIAVASARPEEVGNSYLQVFKRCGTPRVSLLNLDNREDAETESILQDIHKATGVFFTGGDQVRITRLLGGTQMDALLHQRHQHGLVIAGTSAGAAMMSQAMITGGTMTGALRFHSVELGPGMEFLPGVVIDQHFQERWRFPRLLAAIAQHPHDLGIGINEDTAIIVRDHSFQVIGQGSVTVVDAKRLTFVSRPEPDLNNIIGLSGVTLHVLIEGMGYDLRARKPLLSLGEEDEARKQARAITRNRRKRRQT